MNTDRFYFWVNDHVEIISERDFSQNFDMFYSYLNNHWCFDAVYNTDVGNFELKCWGKYQLNDVNSWTWIGKKKEEAPAEFKLQLILLGVTL